MRTGDPGGWLTATRVERLAVLLRAVRAQPPGLRVERAAHNLWKTCGGPLDDVTALLDVLATAGLLRVQNGRIRTSRQGRQVSTQDHQQGGTLLARSLIAAGYFTDQARHLLEVAVVDSESGAITCRRLTAITAAPQLVGILRRFPGVTVTDTLFVPPDVAAQLADVWNIPPTDRSADQRAEIGERGELYSYRYEQVRASDSAKVHWVARDDDTLGYDIENLDKQPRKRIEVKASSAVTPRFFLSANEWKVAHRDPDNYEVHFWGGVNLQRPPRDDYTRLCGEGFPIVYRNVPALLASGGLSARPSQYIVFGASATSNESTGPPL